MVLYIINVNDFRFLLKNSNNLFLSLKNYLKEYWPDSTPSTSTSTTSAISLHSYIFFVSDSYFFLYLFSVARIICCYRLPFHPL